jgi:hypothetical protein
MIPPLRVVEHETTRKLTKNYLDVPGTISQRTQKQIMKLIYVTISCDIIFERGLRVIDQANIVSWERGHVESRYLIGERRLTARHHELCKVCACELIDSPADSNTSDALFPQMLAIMLKVLTRGGQI